jgi:erythromycin esterase-like protein
MGSYLFRKLSSVITFSIFVLMIMATMSVAIPAQRRTCRSVSGLSALLKRGNILLFGELHGTQQAPAFIADVVCRAAKKRILVTLGLEIPFEEQAAIDRFLNSKGGEADKAQLTEGAFWNPAFPDGRSSLAMLQLVEQVRALRAAGAKLRIVAFTGAASLRSQERDRAMAETLASVIKREPKGLLVVLSGNIHNRLTRGTSFNPAYEPMGYLLTKSISNSRVISLDMSHGGGEAWGCRTPSPDSDQVTCAAYSFRSAVGAPEWSLKLTDAPDTPFSGTYGVGRITASPPVKGQPR